LSAQVRFPGRYAWVLANDMWIQINWPLPMIPVEQVARGVLVPSYRV
jgi:hypothetical protein